MDNTILKLENLSKSFFTLDGEVEVLKDINFELKEGEKIGYIYSDINSELYQWLTSTVGVKEHIQPYLEKDAHGREA